MNLNGADSEKIYRVLKKQVEKWPRTFIPLDSMYAGAEKISVEMPAFLQSPRGQVAFGLAVQRLVTEQGIVPVGKQPYTQQGLHQKYRINRPRIIRDEQLQMDIIRSIRPPASIDYYIQNPDEFLQDRPIITAMVEFLAREEQTMMTVNERAYQLFGDEKFFKGAGKSRSRGESILRKLGLNYAHLGCVETVEPFFSFQARDFYLREPREVYIVENKDTFWSFKRCLMDIPSIIKVDMLIYGEGKKIISSFKFINEYGIDVLKDKIYYFGDLDAEGINIFCELGDAYPHFDMVPFRAGYQAILEIGMKNPAIKTHKKQRIKAANIERFIKALDSSRADQLKELLEGGFYIPQEALSAAVMLERFGIK